ncbi:MAG: HNH endonuclease [Spirochaetes bacterium]|nr:HNH endonuclease [Spirochaetota bacterium]
MKIKRETAMKLWDRQFGGATTASDFKGRVILKAAYGQDGSQFGWNIDHIQPKALGGTDRKENLQIVHIETNREKATNGG